MQVLEYFCKKNLKYNFINKFSYNSVQKINNFKKIILFFKTQDLTLKTIATHLLFFELLSNKKGTFIKSKKHNLILKIKTGNPVGCKLILSKNKKFKFLKKFLLSILLFKSYFLNNIHENNLCFFFSIRDSIRFFSFKQFFNVFTKLVTLHIVFLV